MSSNEAENPAVRRQGAQNPGQPCRGKTRAGFCYSFPSCTWERTCLRSCTSPSSHGETIPLPPQRYQIPSKPSFPKLHLGTHLPAKLHFAIVEPMRSRYRINEPHLAHFVTSSIVAWLPVFTKAARCQILTDSLAYCREHKGLRIYGWVILDTHFHALLAAPDLSGTLSDLKRHTAQRLLDQLESERCEWLLHQLKFRRAAHKSESKHQIWQEGVHPQAIPSDEIMLQKLEYLHNNPVKRGLVAAPEHWRFSSAHEWCPGVETVLRCDSWR